MGVSASDLLWERKRRRYRGSATGDWWDIPVEDQLQGFLAFCADHVTIAHPQGKRAFTLRKPQIETVRAYLAQDQTLILKARQIGFTTVTMAFCLWRMLFFDDYSIIMLSRKEDDASAALAMVILAYNEMTPEARAHFPLRTDKGSTKFTLANGSWMESHPSANNPARGRSASLMILDEWAFMPNPDEAWAATAPVTDIGGRLVALSTANGWGNLFHSAWVKSQSGDNNWHGIFYPWWAVPERDPEGLREQSAWYQAQKRDMMPWQLAQEYPSNPEEAFIKSGNPVFDVDALRTIIPEEPLTGALVGSGSFKLRELDAFPDGPLRVYESPQRGSWYAVWVDVAQGLEHGDYSSVHVINIETGMVAAHWHGHADPDVFGEEVAALGWFYNVALVGVEVNNHGLTTAKTLQRLGYPNMFYRRRLGSKRETISEELGWLTTRSSKPFIIDGLNSALKNDLVLLDQPTIAELMVYVRKPDGATEGSPHDDRVMSLAIANEMRRHVHSKREEAKFVIPKGSIAWEMAEMEREERESALAGTLLGRNQVRGMSRVGVR